MKNILILGAGLVAGPAVQYLLEQTEFQVTVADQFIDNCKKLIGSHGNGRAIAMDCRSQEELSLEIDKAHTVVSLLPWAMHPLVAKICLEKKKHLVTASYVKEDMQAKDDEAKEKGLCFLNEVGVDPGLDHMSAMQVIDSVKAEGKKVKSFFSYCGGLPAHDSNNNPLGYKFSWSPEGALLAATNDGKYIDHDRIIEVSGENLFDHYWLKSIPQVGVFEAYVNRDALPYRETYGLEGVDGMYRGTLRNVGYCETWSYLKKLGLLNQHMKFDFDSLSPKQMMANIVNCKNENVRKHVATYLKIPEFSLTLKKLEWLGLFSDRKLNIGTASVFEMLAHTLQQKLVYGEGERDLLVLHHEFEIYEKDNSISRIQSTMIDTGKPGGHSSMARTVGYPVGISARLITEGTINQTGVCIPIKQEIYKPILEELETVGIRFIERFPDYSEERNFWGDWCYEETAN